MPVRGREEKPPFLKRFVFLLLAGLVLLLDQLSKAWALSSLSRRLSVPLLPEIFHLTLVKNQGIAFGLFQNSEKILFGLITASIVILAWVGLRLHPFRFKTQIGIGLILGGALGNWVDRIRTGAVVDFLDFRIWPVFNLADSAITIGVALFLLDFFKSSRGSHAS